MKKGFSKKTPSMPKKLEGGPFILARYCMIREKKEKPFWFSSLGQMVQFDTIKFCRTFKNYFGQFVWIENQSRVCGKRVGLGHFHSDSLESQPYEFIEFGDIGSYYGVENDCRNFRSNRMDSFCEN